jgi:hypothetical protein
MCVISGSDMALRPSASVSGAVVCVSGVLLPQAPAMTDAVSKLNNEDFKVKRPNISVHYSLVK